MKILHLSDLHIDVDNKISVDQVKSMFDFIKSSPDITSDLSHVFISGDLINKADKPSQDELNVLLGELQAIDDNLKIITVRGNHDLQTKDKSTFIESDDANILTIDTGRQHKGEISRRDFTNIRHALEATSSACSDNDIKPLMIIMHHPPIASELHKKSDSKGLSKKSTTALAILVDKFPNVLVTVFAGHIHPKQTIDYSVGESFYTIIAPSLQSYCRKTRHNIIDIINEQGFALINFNDTNNKSSDGSNIFETIIETYNFTPLYHESKDELIIQKDLDLTPFLGEDD